MCAQDHGCASKAGNLAEFESGVSDVNQDGSLRAVVGIAYVTKITGITI